MALGIHIQPTLDLGSGEIRFSLSDAVALLLAPFAVWLVLQNRHFWSRRETWIALGLIAASSVVMTIGLVKAGMSPSGISGWAWVKYVGWYVLLYYGVLGVIAGSLASEAAINWFVRVFVFGHCVLILTYILTQSAGISLPGSGNPRMSGLVDNPNAYGLSLLCALALMLGSRERVVARMPKFTHELICGLLVAGILFTRSLGALGGFVVFAMIALAVQRDFSRIVRVSCIALALYALPWAGNSLVRLAGFDAARSIDSIGAKLSDPDKYAFSWSVRVESNSRAFALWRETPLFGSGLGVFYEKEKTAAQNGKEAIQVHNTLIWILAEFGLVGLCVFGVLFVAVALYLLRASWRLRGTDPPGAGLALAGLMILGGWATMSLAHEMLYQRLPWLIVGTYIGYVARARVRLLRLRNRRESL